MIALCNTHLLSSLTRHHFLDKTYKLAGIERKNKDDD